MLQRIQTIYLLLTVILISLMFFLPIAGLQNVQDAIIYELNYKGLFELNASGNALTAHVWMLTALMLIYPVGIGNLSFCLRKRFLQNTLGNFQLIVFDGSYYGMLFIYLWQWKIIVCQALFRDSFSFSFGVYHLNILAVGAIAKDEALIRS